jgi:hypothetical protein
MLAAMINIETPLLVSGIRYPYVAMFQNHGHMTILTLQLRKTSQFENRNFGPA